MTHLNAKTGRRYNPKAISTRKLLNARLQEGYQVEDFIKVIDTKVSHWLNDEKYNMYLRPGTLFGAKFDNYINENVSNSDKRNGSCSDEEVWYE
ncbi:conserved phage C-terminal domain-containing protein [Periweissella fabaria]|uniref:conserved phage C-terminal domain-containing protein n=1 Tax=Periweissella fabaria TaxID=546157 RepID=UPI0025B7271D|nr:conserved phage C-terminal domain-containing protein [Periweissella fabaria]